MSEQTMIICGLPESGKTTFLAALWHLVTSREITTRLEFESLRNCDASHLNSLASRWRNGEAQIRTDLSTNNLVSMNLKDSEGKSVRLTFPDLSGEAYRRMWEERECEHAVTEILTSGNGVLLFIHADRIIPPQWVVDVAAQSKALGIPIPEGQEVHWHPRLSPTQVKVIDLLQLLKREPLDVGGRRVVVVLSAWDKVAVEGRMPDEFLFEKLPMLDQYLHSEADGWNWKIYGVSAQGGDYEAENKKLTETQLQRLEELKALDKPSLRIKVVSGKTESYDLTEPIEWLMT